jgi:HSP20 family protein
MALYFSNPYETTRRMMARFMDAPWNEEDSEIFFPMDVKAEDDAYVITAVLPGLKPEDLNIQIVNDTVNLQGVFKNNRDEKASYLLHERPFGVFSRTLTLPEPLDANGAEASLSEGILTLRVPKSEEARPKSIKVVSK